MNIIKVYKLDEVGYQRDFTSLNEIWDLGLSMVKTNFTSNGRSLILRLSSCVLGKTSGKFRKNLHIIFSRQSHHLLEHVFFPSVIVASSHTLFIGLLDLLIRHAISIGDGMIGMRQFVNDDRLRGVNEKTFPGPFGRWTSTIFCWKENAGKLRESKRQKFLQL